MKFSSLLSLFRADHTSDFSRSLIPSSIFIVIICQLVPLSHALNHPPTLKLHIALGEESNVLEASEETPLKSLLGVLQVEDPDAGVAGVVDCQITSNFVGLGEISPDVYKVEVVTHLDRELTDREEVSIDCTDGGSPPMSQQARFTIVIHDVNDNVPTFTNSRYEFSIAENGDTNIEIGRVQASDLDTGENGEVEYSLGDETGDVSDHFYIDSKTGMISCAISLDREVQKEITLYAYATDHGSTPLMGEAEVVIKVVDKNDNTPSILTSDMAIKEEQPPMTLVGMIEAVDKDSGKNAQIEYELVSGKDGSSSIPPFIVEADGSVYAAVPFNRELKDQYIIDVSASDLGEPSLSNISQIVINVLDVNDHRPVILSPDNDEDQPSGNRSDTVSIDWYSPDDKRPVFKVSATDIDMDENAKLYFAIEFINDEPFNKGSLFHIDRDTGVIYLQRYIRSTEDRNQILTLLVRDGGNPSLNATAWLTVMLDVDFKSLVVPPTRPPTPATVDGGNSASMTMSRIPALALVGLGVILYGWGNLP